MVKNLFRAMISFNTSYAYYYFSSHIEAGGALRAGQGAVN
jgi:hypothetical protein